MNFSGFQPTEWTNFSGGFTENVYSDDTSFCARNDNLLIDRNKKPYLRPGSNLYYIENPQHPNGSNRVGRFMKFPDDSVLFAQSADILAYADGSAFTAITGAGGHSAFPALTTDDHVSWGYWKDQFFMTPDNGSPVMRAYRDGSDVWHLIQAGLPALDATQYSSSATTALANAITLANDIRTNMPSHFTDVTDHTGHGFNTHIASDTVSNGMVTAPAASDLASLLTLTGQLLRAYQNHHLDSQTSSVYHRREIPQSSWATLTQQPVATVASRTLASVAVPTTLVGAMSSLNDLKKCYNTHQGRVDIHGDTSNGDIYVVATDGTYGFVQGPQIALRIQKLYDYANTIKTKYNAHLAAAASTTAFNHATADATNNITAANATTPETLQALLWSLQLKYAVHEDDAAKAAAWSYHVAKESAAHLMQPAVLPGSYTSPPYPDFYGGLRAGNWSEMITLMNQMKNVFNGHFNDVSAHQAASSGTPNPFQIPGLDLTLASYLYAFHYFYSFTSGTLTYEIAGPVLEVAASQVVPTQFEGLAIANIPVLANTASQNYDTANIKIKIFRTTDGGNTFYLVDTISNGTTSYTDYTIDSVLQTKETIYINGGVVDHEPPPLAKCLHVVNNTGYYGAVTDTGEYFPNRVRQSVPDAPDACPGDFFDDLEDSVVGISSAKTIPIVGCSHSFYRLDGLFTAKGAGQITHQAISQTVGLVSEASLVRVDDGVFFAGTDAFYFTDGYRMVKLSHEWDRVYAGLIKDPVAAKHIQGTLDTLNRKIWWAVRFDSGNSDNDGFVILDLDFGLERTCWTTASNSDHLSPSAAIALQGSLVRGHPLGYIFLHDDDLTTDPYIDTTISPDLWGKKAIIFDWKSTFVAFGTTNIRKWCPLVEFNLQNDSNLNLAVFGFNDNDRSNHQLSSLFEHDYWFWGDETIVWGEPRYLWNFHGNLDEKRYVPAGSLRCTYKQIELTNDFVVIQTSQDKGAATISKTALTVTLDTAGKYWPLDPEGYFISFAYDNYTTSYEIVRKNSTTIPTVLTLAGDPNLTLQSVSSAWKISGYPKEQKFHLLDMTLWGKPLSASQTGARSG